jgi:hypothetical protein
VVGPLRPRVRCLPGAVGVVRVPVLACRGEHDRDPDALTCVQVAVPADMVDRPQLARPRVEPDGQPGRGVAGLDAVPDDRAPGMTRPTLPLGRDEP